MGVKLGEHRQRVLENRVLRRIFGSKRDVVQGHGEGRRLRDKEICDLFHTMWRMSLLAEDMLTPQEGLCCMELVSFFAK